MMRRILLLLPVLLLSASAVLAQDENKDSLVVALDSLAEDSVDVDSIAEPVDLPWPQNVQARLDAILKSRQFLTTQIGLQVYDLTADSVIYQYNERQQMRPASTMKMINAVYAEIIKVTSFGPEADFCLILYEQNGFNDMRFGEADVLARSKNTAVDKMAKEGLVDSAKGIVRLKTREELSAFSPHSENLWLITQQVVQACEKNGYAGTAAIFSQLNGAQTDQVKKMCYRLYKIADSKGWSKDGQAYNAVIAGWDAMAHEAAQLKQQKNQAVQGTLGF